MDKKFINKQKQKLLQTQEKLEQEIKRLQYPKTGEKGSSNLPAVPDFDGSLEEEADQVEEYGTLLSIDYVLKRELRKIKHALSKIQEGNYGVCEKCDKEISKQRLQVYPQARLCKKCSQREIV